jgi:hypothetical protein
VDGLTTEGVPVIFPVVAERVRPAGRAGLTDQETTVPPVDAGDTVVIALPLVNVKAAGV